MTPGPRTLARGVRSRSRSYSVGKVGTFKVIARITISQEAQLEKTQQPLTKSVLWPVPVQRPDTMPLEERVSNTGRGVIYYTYR